MSLRLILFFASDSGYPMFVLFVNTPLIINTKQNEFLRRFADLTRSFGIPSKLNTQSIDYISQPFVLNIDRIKKECSYAPISNFYDSLPSIIAWVNNVGYRKVKKGHKELPWIHVNQRST